MNHEQIARIAHEVNRAYCAALGDNSQPAWEEAPDWQKNSVLNGVALHLHNPDIDPEASHAAWCAKKEADGWIYGPIKDMENRTHPNLVLFDLLPREQQAKDFIFRAVVHAFAAHFTAPEPRPSEPPHVPDHHPVA